MKLKIKGSNKQKAALYPEIGDQLDALWKIVENIPGPQDAEKVRKSIINVKKKLKANL